MSSPLPEISSAILRCMNEILSPNQDPKPRTSKQALKEMNKSSCLDGENSDNSSSCSDFDSDDSQADPDYHVNGIRSIPSSFTTDSEAGTPKNTRKKKSNSSLWKSNIRKKLRENGEEYINIKKMVMPARKIKPPCKSTCFFMCTKNFTEDNRKSIHSSFWRLSDQEKNSFYSKFVRKNLVKRRRIEKSTKKQNSFNYYFENDEIRQVCKTFFLNTLDINEKRIYYYFKVLHDENGAPLPRRKGKNIKRVTSEEKINEVREHINSFPVMDSHYCRASSTRKYLDQSLTLKKMYDFYVQKVNDPVLINVYRHVFNYSFNLSFYKPKKDQCNLCFLFKNNKNPSLPQTVKFNTHRNEIKALKAEREMDRNNIDPSRVVVCFDLQSVFSLPKGPASIFYYKRKINTYNLTATACFFDQTKKHYCCVWDEIRSGRSGNDLASALYSILENLIHEYPNITKITLWSDACVPQNKNQIMATALKYFIARNSHIRQVIQKFSEPGHSLIQEVDSLHSVIDRNLKSVEIGSILLLIKLLKSIRVKNEPLKIIQMKVEDFYLYSKKSCYLNYQIVPFSKIRFLKYEKDEEYIVYYKESAYAIDFNSASTCIKPTRKNLGTPSNLFKQKLENLQKPEMNKDKVNDIKALLPYLSETDSNYFKVMLKIN